MERERERGWLGTLVVAVVAAAVAGVVGWLLLLFIKGIVVLVTYAIGIALIVVPLLLARRIVGGQRGKERRRRIRAIAVAVLLGVVLCVVANQIDEHGWLLIAVPAAFVAADRIIDRVQARR